MFEEDDLAPHPLDAARVAARALVLAAVSCRALIKKDAHESDCEETRGRILP